MRGFGIPPKVVRRGGHLLLMVVLLLPIAGADASGEFLARGRVTLPEGSDLSGAPSLGLLHETGSMQRFTLDAPRARIHLHEMVLTETPLLRDGGPAVETGGSSSVHHLTDLHVEMVATREGYLGFYGAEGAAVQMIASSASTLGPNASSVVSSGQGFGSTPTGGPFDTRYYFHQEVDAPHVLSAASGTLRYEGAGIVKLYGPAIRWWSAEGDGAYATGEDSGEDLDLRQTYRWAIIELEDAVFEVESPERWTLALQDAQADWQGTTFFTPASGAMSSGSTSYVATGGAARLEGTFQGTFRPHADPSGGMLLRVALVGDVVSTTLRPQAVAPAPDGPAGSMWLLPLAIALATGALGFSGGLLLRRARARPAPTPIAVPVVVSAPAPEPAEPSALPFTAEDCCDAGAKAASEEDWAEAAKWFARAHRLAPTSARICADLAFSLSQIGDVDESLVLFHEASRLSTDGEADFNGALAALQAGKPLDEVEEWLERALSRTPGLVLPLDADNDFLAMAGRPRYESAIRRARERVAGRARGGIEGGRSGA